MLYQDWVDDGLMVRIPDARGKNIDKYYDEELSDTQRQRIDNCTRRLWEAGCLARKSSRPNRCGDSCGAIGDGPARLLG